MSDGLLTPNEGLKFRQVFDRIAWAAMTAICFYAAGQIRGMAESVQELNKNFAVMVERVSNQQGQLTQLGLRVSDLEASDVRARRRARD